MERPPAPADARAPGGAAEPAPADRATVEELLRAVSTALRNHRLYGGRPAAVERFVDAVRRHLAEVWEIVPRLDLSVEERAIRWEGRTVHPTGGDTSDLPFLFYKDGIRSLALLPGFEDEIPAFLDAVARAPTLREEEDDLVTLLWAADLAFLRYAAVEVGTEEADVGSGEPGGPRPVPADAVRAEAARPATAIAPEDFQETLYFLDESETRRLAEEVRREAARDLWGDVTAALFDRLEDGSPERQLRVVRILDELLAHALGVARFERAADFLTQLAALAARPGLLAPPVLREVRSLFRRLADPGTVRQLALTLEEHPGELRDGSLGSLLGFFPPDALGPLMRAADAVARPDVRRAFERAIERLAVDHRDAVVDLLGDADAGVAAGAARWVGRLGIGAAVPALVGLLGRPEPPLRLAAVAALQELRAATAGKAIQAMLGDAERDVRVAAVRALAALRYAAARPAVEEIVASKRLRAADRTEKMAFFEAYGQLAGGDAVALLERTLNGRGWLGRGESAEMRACAALALGRVRHPAARSALAEAARDADPVVRTAVARALREEEA